jgi:triphosphatase
MAAAGRIVLRKQLLRMLEREPAARTGEVLAIKQMRVATRRMRAGWRVFGDAYRKNARRRYVAELRRVAHALGEVRDRDVLLERLPAQVDLAPLDETWRTRRAEAHAALVALLDDKAYGKFVDDYLEFSASADAALPKDATPETLADAAPARVAAAVERMRAAGAAAQGTADPLAWHTLRISARRLRYTIEALRDALDQRAAADLIARLVRVQDVLGAMNDAALAAAEAEAWLAAGTGDSSATTSDAVRAYAGEQHAEMARLRRSFAAVWRGASGVGFARDLARCLQSVNTAPTSR